MKGLFTGWTLSAARGRLFFVLFLLSFFLVRVYINSPVFFVADPADDTGYLAYTQSMLRGEALNFDWCDPGVTDGNLKSNCKISLEKEGRAHAYNMYTPGPALVLLPVTFLGHVLHRLGIFTPANIDYLTFWSIVGTFFIFLIGSLLVFEITLFFLKDLSRSWWMTIFFVVGNPVTYFVFRRPLMSHAAEYFLFFAGIYLLIQVLKAKKPVLPSLLLGAVAGLMLITRLNNIHFPAVLGIMLLFWPGEVWSKNRFLKVGAYIAGTLPVIFVFLFINFKQKGTFVYSTQSYYEAYTIGFFLRLHWSNPLRVLTWFAGPHWGLIWLVPMTAYIFAYLFRIRRPLMSFVSGHRRLPLALLLAVFLVHANMMANGPTAMSFAYRYVFTYYFFLQVLFLLAVSRFGMGLSAATFSGFSKRLQVLFVFSALLGCAHIMNYETRVPSLRPQFPLVPVSSEWIYHPFWRDQMTWTSPYFAFHSIFHTLKLNPVMSIAASPILALPVVALGETSLKDKPGIRTAVEYYRSDMRKVNSLSDIWLTYWFELFFGFAAIAAFFLTRRWRTL